MSANRTVIHPVLGRFRILNVRISDACCKVLQLCTFFLLVEEDLDREELKKDFVKCERRLRRNQVELAALQHETLGNQVTINGQQIKVRRLGVPNRIANNSNLDSNKFG